MARRLLALLTLLAASAAPLALAACGAGGFDPITKAFGGGSASDSPAGATMSTTEYSYAQQVVALVNEERVARGIEPVAWSDPASNAAYQHAVDMDHREFFDHYNPDGDDPGERLAESGLRATSWGENIAMGQGSPRSVMDAWMNSPGHRANILAPGYRSLGVGVHLGTDGPWWVQDFVR